ncbi:LysR family transcriptional regulator [Rhizobium sp.]|uniref:LysR family transcriptional regulator n=1 Tax=Rhizobium sp. TaxID=391 RepID=UPI0034C6875B
MNWNDVRYFLAVTRRIETMEAALKSLLFERRPDGYELTEAGRSMVEKAIAIEAAMHKLEDSF